MPNSYANARLLAKLENESEDILLKFSNLVTTTEETLRNSGVALKQLLLFFEVIGLENMTSNTKYTHNIAALLNKVTHEKCWTFFSYKLLETLIRRFCTNEPVVCVLEEYTTAFKEYCTRRVYEIPVDAITHTTSFGQQLCIKLDEIFPVLLKDIDKVQDRVASILNIDFLVLVHLNHSGIELTFKFFEKANAIFPISEERKLGLALIGVKWLQCGQYTLVVKELPNFKPFFIPRKRKLHHEFIPGKLIAQTRYE